MRILILSNTPWANENSFGNSYSNIFGGIEDIEIANIYCRYGEPNNNIVSKYFQITEKSLLKNFFYKKYPSGIEMIKESNNHVNKKSEKLNKKQKKIFNTIRTQRFQIYYWLRDVIWKIGHWKSKELIQFIDDFQPDIIFQPLYYSNYLNDISLFIKNYTKAPLVSYVSDDVYTLKQFSLSPFYWIDRLIKRKKIKKIVDKSEFLYVISEIQKLEYEKIFQKECKVLTKGANFSQTIIKEEYNKPLQLVYTGNISGGRWKSLALIARQLKKINQRGLKMQLFIYSQSPINRKIMNALNIDGISYFMGGVSSEKIKVIQSKADILVHVEPTNLKGRLQVHQSFSTKIIDYFHAGRCIFAVGTPDMASINYLLKNNAGIIAENEKEIEEKLMEILDDNSIMDKKSKNAVACGIKNHEISKIQFNLMQNLNALLMK